MKDQIVTVAELFQNELDAINNYIVLIENKKKITVATPQRVAKTVRSFFSILIWPPYGSGRTRRNLSCLDNWLPTLH